MVAAGRGGVRCRRRLWEILFLRDGSSSLLHGAQTLDSRWLLRVAAGSMLVGLVRAGAASGGHDERAVRPAHGHRGQAGAVPLPLRQSHGPRVRDQEMESEVPAQGTSLLLDA